ncbi:response regulator [Pseudidiomarina aquimaris]|uniref:response regulator n=1 Tax=Pseudidiomarina aquimaris TaxID=641841 RepID=UPI003A96B706
MLESWGARVTSATSATALAAVSNGQQPDLLIIDYHLDNNVTGIEVLHELRQQPGLHDLAAIVISADPDEVLREQAIAGQAGFMPKPLKPAALRRLLKRYLK